MKARFLRFYSKGSTESVAQRYWKLSVRPSGQMKRWLALGVLLATGVALSLRCPRLDIRPMHNDEAVNALKFGQLWSHGTYQYDPHEFHGPTLAYSTLFLGRLTSAPDFNQFFSASRLHVLTLLCGVGLILLLPLVARWSRQKPHDLGGFVHGGFAGMVFYSRYYIHEMLLSFSRFC